MPSSMSAKPTDPLLRAASSSRRLIDEDRRSIGNQRQLMEATAADRQLTASFLRAGQQLRGTSKRYMEERDHQSDEYLLSAKDDDLYAARINYLHVRRENCRTMGRAGPFPGLLNFGNSDAHQLQQQGSQERTILTYDKVSQLPTRDLQTLVLVLTREQLRKEIGELSGITGGGQKDHGANMRPNSFIANTPDLICYWRVTMLNEAVQCLDQFLSRGDRSWVKAGSANKTTIPMPMDEEMLMSLPPDKPEISKSQVATEYIQAQRGYTSDFDEATQLFLSETLKAEVAATTSPEAFEHIVEGLRLVVQKTIEIEFIEKKPETVHAVEKMIGHLKSTDDMIVPLLIKEDYKNATELGKTMVRILVDHIMTELHANHRERDFEPLRVLISARKE